MISVQFRRLVTSLLLLLVVSGAGYSQEALVRKVIHEDGYLPTPGDVYTLTINYGVNVVTGVTQETETIPLILNNDYTIEVPYIGSINVRGLSYARLQSQITTRFRERALAQFVSLNLTAPAVYDVFVWGAVETPGFHTISSLNRLTDLLAMAGGPRQTGSLRRVEVHSDSGVRNYDLVAYTSRGDREQNPFIRPDDRVYVPVAQAAVELSGAVVTPGSYEILEGETIGDVVALAGGLLPTAELDRISVLRINDSGVYTVVQIDSTDPLAAAAQTGDLITIPSSTRTTETIQVEGAFYQGPAEQGTPRAIPVEPILLEIPYTPGMSVLQVLESLGGPTHFAAPENSFIERSDGERVDLPDMAEIWEGRLSDRDIALQPDDRLVIPMKPLLVAVGGEVNAGGVFPFTSGYFVHDYIRLAGGIDIERGSLNRIMFVNEDGSTTSVGLNDQVPIGATIYVGRNGWTRTKEFMGDVFTITGWVGTVLALSTAIIEFAQLIAE
jgi:polysaccharide export outer membrane protein